MDKYIDVNCEVFDLEDLLKKYFEDGFTLDSLNLILGTEIDDMSNCSLEDKENVMEFLSFIYVQKVSQDNYLLNILNSLEELFHISRNSIAKHVGLGLDEFEELIHNPVKHSNKLDSMFRLVNFFNAVSKASV